ncbi:hypothetical protein IWQ56_006304, partial [Coemansia nantahalensis]
IQDLNRRYRMRDAPTDILSFPFHATAEPESFRAAATTDDDRNLGDMFLSMPYVAHHCRANNETLPAHLPVLLTHGLCHLMGYDHERDSDFEKMAARERAILRRLREHPGAPPI